MTAKFTINFNLIPDGHPVDDIFDPLIRFTFISTFSEKAWYSNVIITLHTFFFSLYPITLTYTLRWCTCLRKKWENITTPHNPWLLWKKFFLLFHASKIIERSWSFSYSPLWLFCDHYTCHHHHQHKLTHYKTSVSPYHFHGLLFIVSISNITYCSAICFSSITPSLNDFFLFIFQPIICCPLSPTCVSWLSPVFFILTRFICFAVFFIHYSDSQD